VAAASIEDQPGGLARVLTSLRKAGADLDLVVARRAAEKPGTGVVFVAPLGNELVVAAAEDLGFNVASLHALRVEDKNRPGIAAELTTTLAEAGINLRGLSSAVMGPRFIMHIGVDTAADASKALRTLW
jgi:hypothetical protein